MSSHLKISFYNPVNLRYQDGGEYWIIEVAKRLSALGHEVSIFTTGWRPHSFDDVGSMPEVAAKVVELRYVRFWRGYPFPFMRDLDRLIKAFNNSDVVYFYVYPPNELALWILKYKINSSLVGGFHTFLLPNRYLIHRIYLPIFRKALYAFDSLHVLNKLTANLLNDWGYNNVYLIPNGVDTNTFRMDISPAHNVFNVLYSGRLIKDKGADTLLEIIRYVNEKMRIKNIKFSVCGKGPLKSIVEEFTQKYKNVKYMGFVSRESLPQVYANADLFLIPSKSEGMPLRLLEAQSCGLPAIGSNIPGIADIIINGKTGQLIDAENIEAFAEAIEKYYLLWRDSPEQYYAIRRTIREYIINNYDWNIIIEKIEKMLMESIKNCRKTNTNT